MDNIICPYCNFEFKDFDFRENNPSELYELDCPCCRKIMMVMFEYWPSFDAKKAPCLNGGDHVYRKMTGIPGVLYKYKRRCKYCEKEIIIDE